MALSFFGLVLDGLGSDVEFVAGLSFLALHDDIEFRLIHLVGLVNFM